MNKKTKLLWLTGKALSTKKLGAGLAKTVIKKKAINPFIISLNGDLGSGKTTFLQGFAAGLGIKEKILSPTFVIAKRFEIKGKKQQYKNFYHIDCYRLTGLADLKTFNFQEIISGGKNIIAIEWADKIRKAIPSPDISIAFKFLDKNKREIILSGTSLGDTIRKDE